MNPEYVDRIAVITGGARGFGLAFGRALAARGAHAVLVDVDAGAGEAAAKALVSEGLRASSIACDVACDEEVEAMVAQVVRDHGGIDILINNAGLHSQAYNEPMSKSGMAKLRRLFDVNVMAVIACSLAARPAMAGRPAASIVNIASTAAYLCNTAYGVSKLAVRGLTVTLAGELAADGIRVNAIAPGMMATATVSAELPDPVKELVLSRQILKRWGEESDIVEAMLYLTSSRSGFVVGETLRVGGGFALQV